MKKANVILEKSFSFAFQIIELYKKLVAEKEFILSKQVLRSAASIGANVVEATAAISKREITSKMSISSKEARETRYWLRLLEKSKLINVNVFEELKAIDDLINLLTAIFKTSQEKL